jgi:hypothetical protein
LKVVTPLLSKKKILHALLSARAEGLINDRVSRDFSSFLDISIEKKKKAMQKRGAELVKCTAQGKVRSVQEEHSKASISYDVYFQFLIKQEDFIYIEEEIEPRMAVFYKDTLITDEWMNVLEEKPEGWDLQVDPSVGQSGMDEMRAGTYNRLAAVRYAETWWNSYNPKYKKFENDCTNFISQCIHEGGVLMKGYPDRGKGWWMKNHSWSYSWSVANAFYTYLKHSPKTKQLADPVELRLGDVICYDFEGDGRWNHTTIVTAKDVHGMPLVNAHTYNSRMRYWAYEDSSAYTPGIKYAFFHIVD